jgi:hypothetical protein
VVVETDRIDLAQIQRLASFQLLTYGPGAPVESNWILHTGIWNDDGIWIDSSAWRD